MAVTVQNPCMNIAWICGPILLALGLAINNFKKYLFYFPENSGNFFAQKRTIILFLIIKRGL